MRSPIETVLEDDIDAVIMIFMYKPVIIKCLLAKVRGHYAGMCVGMCGGERVCINSERERLR